MKHMNTSILMVITLVGCQTPAGTNSLKSTSGQPTGTTQTAAPIQTFQAPTAPSSPSSNIALTYYQLSKTVAPISGFNNKTYTAIGSCVVFESKTYCWDNGLQTINFVSGNVTYGPYNYTYFGMGKFNATNWGPCSGGCVTDLISAPTIMSQDILINLPDQTAVNTLLTTGTPKNVSCTEDNGILNCVDFTIDLNQLPL